MGSARRATACLTIALLFVCADAACIVGPKYVKPAVPTPPSYKEIEAPAVSGEWKHAEPQDQAARGRWWETFNDAQLNELEARLDVSNQTIAAAAATVQMARARVRGARAQYYPVVTAAPSIMNARIATGFGTTLGITYTNYSLPIEASWEPDLWGRVRNTVKSSTFAAQASVADLEAVRLSAQSELASDYYELRAQDTLRQLLDAAVDAYQEAFDLTYDRYVAGLESDQAVALAETQLKTTRAEMTSLGVLRAQYEHAIAVLCGEPPSAFSLAAQALPGRPPDVPVGIPSELLERRPDVAAGERAVAQANAQIGIAQSAFYPVVALSATLGFQNLTPADWLTWPSRIWSLGPSLVQTIFDGGSRRATVEQVQAGYDQVVANYRQTVLTAFQQVEDNLAALRILARVLDQENDAIASAERSLEDANVRYQSGLDSYLSVIVAQTALLNLQQAAVNTRAQQMVAAVQLIKALGGGWDATQIPTEQALGRNPPKGSNKTK